MFVKPISIHRKLPLTSVPIFGINNAINSVKLNNKNNQSVLKKKLEGIYKNIKRQIMPIPRKSMCFETKKKGSPVKFSAIYMLEDATIIRPMVNKEANDIIKILSAFIYFFIYKFGKNFTSLFKINVIRLTWMAW